MRLRGLDRDEVRSFMAGLAHDLEGLQAQVATLTQENETLKHENQLLRSELREAQARPLEQATDQAASVLNQAQQLADSLIDEAMQAARNLLLDGTLPAARHHGAGQGSRKGAVGRAMAIERAGSEDPSVRYVEYARMFAKVAQVQFQAVLDAFNDAAPAVLTVGDLGGGVSR